MLILNAAEPVTRKIRSARESTRTASSGDEAAAGIHLADQVRPEREDRPEIEPRPANEDDLAVGQLQEQAEVDPDDRDGTDVEPGDRERRADDDLAGDAREDRGEGVEEACGAGDRVLREQGVERAAAGQPRPEGVTIDGVVDTDHAADAAQGETE